MEVHFAYSTLHKSFEGGWGKTFSKVFPQCGREGEATAKKKIVKARFHYSTLHKSFEKGLGGKLFQKFSPNVGAGAKPPQRKNQ